MAMMCMWSCTPGVPGWPGVRETINVLENPAKRDHAYFFGEIWFKAPQGDEEIKHPVKWTDEDWRKDFTKEISPKNGRNHLAPL